MFAPFIFLFAPRKIFETLREKPRWFAPFVIAVLGLALKTILSNSWGSRELSLQLNLLPFFVIIALLVVGVLWSGISSFLYLAIILKGMKDYIPYKCVFSIVSYCGMIMLIGEFFNYLFIRSNITESTLFPVHNRFPLGLDILYIGKSLHPALAMFMYSINPFTLWYFTAVSMGLSVAGGLNKTNARLLSFILWLVATGVAISISMITGSTSIHINV